MTVIRRYHNRLSNNYNNSNDDYKTKTKDCWNPSRVIRSTILGSLGVLAAFTVRDLMMAIFQLLVSPKKSLIAMFAYTIIVFIVVIVATIIWT